MVESSREQRENLSANTTSFALLFQFFACLFLIFAAEAVAGILGFLYRDRVYIFSVFPNLYVVLRQFDDFNF